MVEPVTLRMTSRSSNARGLGTSAVTRLISADLFPSKRAELTDQLPPNSCPSRQEPSSSRPKDQHTSRGYEQGCSYLARSLHCPGAPMPFRAGWLPVLKPYSTIATMLMRLQIAAEWQEDVMCLFQGLNFNKYEEGDNQSYRLLSIIRSHRVVFMGAACYVTILRHNATSAPCHFQVRQFTSFHCRQLRLSIGT